MMADGPEAEADMDGEDEVTLVVVAAADDDDDGGTEVVNYES